MFPASLSPGLGEGAEAQPHAAPRGVIADPLSGVSRDLLAELSPDARHPVSKDSMIPSDVSAGPILRPYRRPSRCARCE